MDPEDADGGIDLSALTRTCRQCLHSMDARKTPKGRTAWCCLHCGRIEI